jgi:hypothetical protein
MNLVNLIESHLSDEVMGRLTSLVGAGEGATRSAVGAAVPALLSGLSHVASRGGSGAQQLIAALGKFDSGSLGSLTRMLTDKPGAVLEQGSGLLTSLLGSNIVSGITNAVARFAGLGSGSVQKLLGYLMPLALGSIASRFAGKALSLQGLTSTLAEQRANITDALPAGFSLDSIPGLAATGSAVRAAAGEVQHAGSTLARWLLPVAGVALLALILWAVLKRPSSTTSPEVAIPNTAQTSVGVPDVGQISSNLVGSFKSITDSLADIKDAATAAAAVPKLKEMGDKLDGMKALMDKLPEAGKTKITELIKSHLGSIDDQLAKLLWIPGVGDKIKPAVDQLMDKFAALGGLQAPQAANVSNQLAEIFSTATGTLTGIKDVASAEAALPRLKEINDQLDAAKTRLAELPERGRATVSSLLKAAIGRLKELADKVVSLAGVGDKVKPVVDSIMGKLNALAA